MNKYIDPHPILEWLCQEDDNISLRQKQFILNSSSLRFCHFINQHPIPTPYQFLKIAKAIGKEVEEIKTNKIYDYDSYGILNDKLLNKMEAEDLSLWAVSLESGVSTPTISKAINSEFITVRLIYKIAKFMNEPMGDIVAVWSPIPYIDKTNSYSKKRKMQLSKKGAIKLLTHIIENELSLHYICQCVGIRQHTLKALLFRKSIISDNSFYRVCDFLGFKVKELQEE